MDDLREKLPSERAEIKKQQEKEAAELKARQTAALREDFTITFQTEHGKRVLAWLAQRCGWGRSMLAVNPSGVIDEKFTTHNAMELNLYLAMRQHLPIDLLKQVEYGQIMPSGTIDGAEIQRVKKTTQSKKRGRK